MTRKRPSEEFAELRARAAALEDQIGIVADQLKIAQHQVFSFASIGMPMDKLDEARTTAVSTYEAYLDLVIEQNVIEARLQD